MSLLKRIVRRLAVFGAIAATACAAPAAEPQAARPAMWKVADSDTTIYLFGTIHMLPKGTEWRSPAFDTAAAGSDTLVIETDVDDQDPTAFAALFRQMASRPGLPPLLERVPADKREALRATLARFKIPENALDKAETWAAAFTLVQLELLELGLDPRSGVDFILKEQFKNGGKSIDQLETNAEQLGYFDTLSEEAQRKFLLAALDDPAALKTEFAGMFDAWSSGNVKKMAKAFNDNLADTPELSSALLARRNANWAKWVRQRLDKPGTVMVAVGAGHLAGDQSVVSMLERDGLKVTRVQ